MALEDRVKMVMEAAEGLANAPTGGAGPARENLEARIRWAVKQGEREVGGLVLAFEDREAIKRCMDAASGKIPTEGFASSWAYKRTAELMGYDEFNGS